MPEHHQGAAPGSVPQCLFCPLPQGGCVDQPTLWGCFSNCDIACKRSECDWTCPGNAHFADRMREVGDSLSASPHQSALRSPSIEDLPMYIPLLQHEYKLEHPLLPPVVALPTFRVVKPMRGGGYGTRTGGAEALRQRFHLGADTPILLASVARDKHLEAYWRSRRLHDVPRKIAEMGVSAITIPNFSFFQDAPRTHTLWNLRRMALVASELSEAGVGVIPHVNALTVHDWNYWAQLLRSQPQLRFVAKEFQTGLSHHAAGSRAFERLRWLQDEVGRDLHPILIAGGRFLRELPKYFKRFTVVDSVPFLCTMHRKEAAPAPESTGLRWAKRATPPGQCLDELWKHNITKYQNWASRRAAESEHHAPELRA